MVASALASAALMFGLAASPASAFHIPGADYSGNAGNGTITFSVSSDGSSVTNLTLHGPIDAPGCSLSSAHYDQIPIINNSFSNGDVSGSFPNPRGAYGHFNILVFSLPMSCRVTGTWSAITSASPNGSDECKAAQAQVKKAKRALRKAKRTGNQTKIKRARKRWGDARSLRDKYCI